MNERDRAHNAIYNEALGAAVEAVRLFREKHGEVPYCGFAWVVVPGNTSFGRFLVRSGLGRKGYPGGIHIWYSAWSRSQSMDLAEAGAEAFDGVLKRHGISSYWSSRPD